jgi:GT2 family glycosyltransferase
MNATAGEQRVSVVMLTYNRREEVLCNLAALSAAMPGVPIVLVDNCSADGTAQAVIERYPHVRTVRAPFNMGAAGRNLGVRACYTPYVAFCDDDTRWEPGALARAELLLDTWPDVAVISGKVLVGNERRVDPICELMAHSPLGKSTGWMPLLLGFMAGACVVRVRAFLGAGGYNARFFLGAEEALLCLDLVTQGWQIVYADSVVTTHYPSSVRDTGQRAWLLARNAIWTAWMRLPADCAWRETVAQLARGRRQGNLVRILGQTIRGMPWVWARRRVVPAGVAEMWRRLHPSVNRPSGIFFLPAAAAMKDRQGEQDAEGDSNRRGIRGPGNRHVPGGDRT